MKKIFKLEELEDKRNIQFLAQELKLGKIVVMPTSTIYGIIANALDYGAVDRVYKIKKREKDKSLIVLVKKKEDIKKYANIKSKIEQEIIDNFFPGSLTLILENNNVVAKNVTSKNNTIGIRQDSNAILNKILNIADIPVVAPSANISGNRNITNVYELEKELLDQVDYIIDAEVLQNTTESTIVKVENDCVNILREGKISKKEILDKLYKYDN